MNAIELYQKILFLDLRPWKMSDKPDLIFKQRLLEVKKEFYANQPHYDINFIKPLSNFRKYYNNLIKYSAINFLNELHLEIKLAANKSEMTYLVNRALNKKLSQKFKEIAQIIQNRNYTPEQFDLKSPNRSKNQNIADESYVIHLLKYHLIRLFMEIQEAYKKELVGEHLNREEIYYKYFNENPPSEPIIKHSTKIDLPIITPKTKKEILFTPTYKDIKPIIKPDLDYEIVINPTKFGEIECNLYEYKIIDIESYFIKSKKRSNHTLLACVYKVLIDNNYFRRNVIGTHKKVKDNDIRKYLDERYCTDTNQQFRRLKQKQIDAAKIKLPWLEKIYPLR